MPRGAVVALLGPNGAGKTTTLKCISGQLDADRRARPRRWAPPQRRGSGPAGPGRAVHHPRGPGHLPQPLGRARTCGCSPSPTKHARQGDPRADLRPVPPAGRAAQAARRPAVRRRAADARHGPRAVDRPGAAACSTSCRWGSRPRSSRSSTASSPRSPAPGVSVLVVEQFARRALAVAQYAVVMVGGRVTAVGEPADIAGRAVRCLPRRCRMTVTTRSRVAAVRRSCSARSVSAPRGPATGDESAPTPSSAASASTPTPPPSRSSSTTPTLPDPARRRRAPSWRPTRRTPQAALASGPAGCGAGQHAVARATCSATGLATAANERRDASYPIKAEARYPDKPYTANGRIDVQGQHIADTNGTVMRARRSAWT